MKEETLRDQFAMAALMGMLCHYANLEINICTQVAYRFADAMMKEREKKEEK